MPSLPKSPRLRRILLAYTVNQLGTWFGYVALAIGVYHHTHSALAVAGLFIAARLLPALLTPVLVALVEFSERRGGLSRLYVVEAGAVLGLAALMLWHFSLVGVLILVAIDGTAALTANSLLRAAAAHTAEVEAPAGAVETAQRETNAALNVAFTATVALGPAAAGVVVTAAGSPLALLVDAVSFLACGALLLDVRPQTPDAGETSVRARLRAAWEHLQTVPQLRGLLLTEALAVVFFASVEPVEVLYAEATLRAGSWGFGLLVAVWGVGMVLGSIVFARAVRRPLKPMLTWGTLAVGLSYIGFAAAPTLAVACAAALVGGVGNGVQWPALISAVQQMTPRELLGRLMSSVEAIGALCPALGFALGGAITQLSSPRTAMLCAGLAATGMTALFLRIARGDLTAPRVEPPPSAPVGVASLAHRVEIAENESF
ncbi:MAG TPA: MFS transporter [Solirubrobacteraceae bacterium]